MRTFNRTVAAISCAASLLAAASPTIAQVVNHDSTLAETIAAMPKNLPRAKAPGLQESIKAAQAAEHTCAVRGQHISVLITDSVGEPVVLLSGDGAGVRSQLIARTKVAIVIRYKAASGDVAARGEKDPALTAEAAADPSIGVLRGGAFPIRRNGETIGVVAVSGGSLGGDLTLDDRCAKAALDRLEKR